MATLDKIVEKLKRKTDDHFPYASSKNSYWSGYFTSKPEHKRMIRELSNLLQASDGFVRLNVLAFQVTKAMRVFANLTEKEAVSAEEVAERALSLSQHHDAVT